MRGSVRSAAILFFAMILCVSALAVPASEFQGRPEGLSEDGPMGYYLWHDEDGSHMRWLTAGLRHHFHGIVRSQSTIRAIRRVRSELGDIVVRTGRRSFRFDATAAGGIDGVDFIIQGNGDVRFDLKLDGHRISTERINIGREGVNPPNNPFWADR